MLKIRRGCGYSDEAIIHWNKRIPDATIVGRGRAYIDAIRQRPDSSPNSGRWEAKKLDGIFTFVVGRWSLFLKQAIQQKQ